MARSRPGFRQSVTALRAAQKPPRGVSYYSRLVNRPLGRLAAAACHQVGLGPHQVTMVSSTLTVTAIVLLATQRPSLPLAVAVSVLLALGFVFDAADGQVARLTRRSSPFGEWHDHLADAVRQVSLHLAVAVAWFRFVDLPSDVWLLLPLGYAVIAVTLFSGTLLTDLLLRLAEASARGESHAGPALASPPVSAGGDRLRAVLLLPADSGVVALSFLAWGATDVFRWVYLAMAAATLVLTVALVIGWAARLRRVR